MICNQSMGLCHKRSRQVSGFSLIELMMVIVIVGILAAIAVPSYQSSVLRSHRFIAQGMLVDTAARQAQYFVNNKTYATTLEELGLSDPYYVNANADLSAEADGIYQIVLVADSGQWNSFEAEPLNSQVNDTTCATLSLSRTGEKGATGTDPSRCW